MLKRRHPVLKWLRETSTSQADLAHRIGVSAPHLSNVLARKRALSMPAALRLALVTGIPVEKLLSDKESAEILESYGNRPTSETLNTQRKPNVA